MFSNVSQTCPNPNTSYYGLKLGVDGKFYGNVPIGGANNNGEVYNVTTAGKITVIHSFNGTDGEVPVGNLVQATDGNFYGVTQQTSASTSTGEIFKITPAGKLTVLHTFNTDGSEGTNIQTGLVAASDGNLYGVTTGGGANNDGVLFQVTHTGTFTKLRDFNCVTDPCNNWVPLAQRTDGTLYGVGNRRIFRRQRGCLYCEQFQLPSVHHRSELLGQIRPDGRHSWQRVHRRDRGRLRWHCGHQLQSGQR